MGPISTLICWATFLIWIVTVDGSSQGCQHQCGCGFKSTGDGSERFEEKTTLRYEVMGGLIGGFTPLLLAGLCYLIYRICCRKAPMRKGSLAPWRENSWAGGKHSPSGGFDRRRGSTPISLYGETEDSFITGNANNPPVPGSGLTSRYTNVHRNLPGNEINQWFKNVNTMKY